MEDSSLFGDSSSAQGGAIWNNAVLDVVNSVTGKKYEEFVKNLWCSAISRSSARSVQLGAADVTTPDLYGDYLEEREIA